MLEELLKEINDWQDATFVEATPQSAATHLYYEAEELKKNPTDPMEMADIFMLVVGVAHLAGIDLLQAVREKFEINKKRVLGEVNEEGFVEHVKKKKPNNYQVQSERAAASMEGLTAYLDKLPKGEVLKDDEHFKSWELRARFDGELPG